MACCDETAGGGCLGFADGEVKKSEHWAYVGKGKGAYETVSDVVFVGEGKGSIHKEQIVVASGSKWKTSCAVALCLLFVLLLGIFLIFGWHQQPAADVPIVETATPAPKEIIIKHHYITQTQDKVVGVPVPGPTQVVYHKVYSPHMHFDCMTQAVNYRAWTHEHQSWCCWKEGIACPTRVVTKDKYVPVTKTIGVKVPKYSYVHVPGPTKAPVVVHVKVPSDPLPPKIVKEPYPVEGERPPPKIHYKYVAKPEPVKVPKIVYDKKVVEVPVPVKKYVPQTVHEKPKVIYKTHTIYDHPKVYDCMEGFHDFKNLWTTEHQEYCCWKDGRGCPADHEVEHDNVVTRTKYVDVPVPSPPKIVIRHHQIVKTTQHVDKHFDCDQAFSNWYFGWSKTKKSWCCAHESRGCPGTWHGRMQIGGAALSIHAEGGGHATGEIYDCAAGFSNWLHGWSDSKKSWCCDHEQKGCVDYHCYHGDQEDWSDEKSEWCCTNFQQGCPSTTVSQLGCDAPCTHHGQTSLCIDRIHWSMEHQFHGRDNACALSYSQVQVECDICRGCSIEAAGCSVAHVATSEPYDCDAALNNFFRAWSPPKKQWCCSTKGKGCEGAHPPAVDPGMGMIWKHVQVNGYWTWIAVAAAGGGAVVRLPYDCHAGLTNWHIGWSAPKKVWCCAHQHMGCEAAAAGGAAGAAGGAVGGGAGGAAFSHSTSTVVHHVVHVVNGGAHAAAAGMPPGAAGHGMEWKWENDGGNWHWQQVHFEGTPEYDCHAGLQNYKLGWAAGKKHWCCHFKGLGCP